MSDDPLDAYLDAVLVGGRQEGVVVLAEPDPRWPDTRPATASSSPGSWPAGPGASTKWA